MQQLNTNIQELDTVILGHDLPEHHLKQGDRGAVVHRYADGKAFEVEFVNDDGDTIALLTLTAEDIHLNANTQSPYKAFFVLRSPR